MKSLPLIFLVLFFSANAFCQVDPEKALNLQKLEKYTRMKKTGTTLTLLGTGLAIVGVVTLMNVESTTTSNGYSTQTTTTGNPGLGIAAYLGGSAMAGAGVPLWIVGGINRGRYERKLSTLTVGARVTPHTAGLTFRYRL